MSKFTYYSDEPHRGLEMFCDSCNEQWPKWYYRTTSSDVFAWGCICTECKNEMELEMNK